MQLTFASCIYVLECGHSSGVRANKVATRGVRWPCASCRSDEVVTDVLTLAESGEPDA